VTAAKRAEVAGKIAFDRVEEHPSAGRETITGDRAVYTTEAQWAMRISIRNGCLDRGPGGVATISRGRSSWWTTTAGGSAG
jgi:hypothetical protein